MIKAENLTKSYNGEACLRGVTLHIAPGELVTLHGENGSGKTTLLEILAGVRRPDSGQITVAGEDISSLHESGLAAFRRTKVGVVYQQFGLIPTLSAEDNIAMPLLLARKKPSEIRARVAELAERLDLMGMLRKRPGELSGGQQQRVAIARALCHRPPLLLLDEPTASLDREHVLAVAELLEELHREGVTVLQITHDERTVASGRVIRLSDGVIV